MKKPYTSLSYSTALLIPHPLSHNTVFHFHHIKARPLPSGGRLRPSHWRRGRRRRSLGSLSQKDRRRHRKGDCKGLEKTSSFLPHPSRKFPPMVTVRLSSTTLYLLSLSGSLLSQPLESMVCFFFYVKSIAFD